MNYTNNGQFVLDKLVLSTNNADIDLSISYITIDLYESLFDSVMTGSVSILDSYNLQDILQLQGSETIELSFATLGSTNLIEFTGIVYKISEKHRISEHTAGYTIFFMSKEGMNNMYYDTNMGGKTTTSDLVEKIYNKKLKSVKDIVVHQTKGMRPFLFGVHKPIEAINILSKYSVSIANDTGYLFYEDSTQFNFVPIEYLYQQPIVRSYSYKSKGSFEDIEQKAVETFEAIQDLEILPEKSYLESLQQGSLGLVAKQYDLLTKTFTNVKYDSQSDFERTKSNADKSYRIEHKIQHSASTTLRINNNEQTKFKASVKGRMTKLDSLKVRVKLTAWGDSNLTVGQNVFAELPNINQDQANLKNAISGNFLIGKIHHYLTNTTYMQTIMLYKNGYTDT